jgi:hypothetical protein
MKAPHHLVSGDKFNRLTVLGFDHTGRHFRNYYLFKCDCGREKVILGSSVVSGNTKSCGCLGHETRKAKILPNNCGVINHLVLQYKRHARERNLEFSLDHDEFAHIISQPCYYCGLPPSNNKITKNCAGFLYSGIDRIDSARGYTSGNVVAACAQCNKAKRDLGYDEFLSWVRRVYTHQAMAEQWGKEK